MRRPYYAIRGFIWDLREWLFVKEAMRRLRRDDEVFIHPLTGGPPRAVLRREPMDTTRHGSHSHLEGRRRAPHARVVRLED